MLRLTLTILALALTAPSFAGPADTVIRDLTGQRVVLDDGETVVLFWSMNDATALSELEELAEVERAGWSVLAVNTDGVTRKSQVRPFLRSRGLGALPATIDVDATLQGSLSAAPGEALVLASTGAVRDIARGASPKTVLWLGDDAQLARD